MPTARAMPLGSSSGASHTPMSPRAKRAARRACHSASGTITGIPSGTSASVDASRNSVQRSSTIVRPLMSCRIDAILEGVEPDAPDRVDEPLVLVPVLDVDVDELHDHLGHLGRRERWSDHLAERRVVTLRAAKRDLVPLLAVLVDAEDADVADVMVAAGVHATGHVELEIPEVVQVVHVVE